MKGFFLVFFLATCEILVMDARTPWSFKSARAALWKERVRAVLQSVRTQPCWRPVRPANCRPVSRLPEQRMNLFIAQKSRSGEKLIATLPDKRHYSLLPSNQHLHDAVIAIDPYPSASFGHLVYVFFVEENADQINCTSDGYGQLTASGDCIRPANKTYCRNVVDERKRKRCWIDFLPLVYSQGDYKKTQRLECEEGILGFGKCQISKKRQLRGCANSQRCSKNIPDVPKMCMWSKCDYAVMVGGEWSAQASRSYHEENLRLFWKFLRHHKFNKNHIATFYGSDGGIELDGDPSTSDASPAIKETGIRRHINRLCDSQWCIDTLVIYLTGTAHSNGALLLWDSNDDGLTENAEKYNVKEIFEDIADCNANKVIIVADYSYSGHLAHRLKKYQQTRWRRFENVTVMTSSQSDEYSWGGEFTKALLRRGIGNNTKCMGQLLKEVRRDFRRQGINSTPTLAEGSRGSGNSTVCGKQCGMPWAQAWKGEREGCTVTPITEIARPRRRYARPNRRSRSS